MVVINEILLPECTGGECGGDNEICTDSRVHHRNAENRAPVTRNHRSAPILGRWLTRDPIGYQGGINLYGYVDSSPVGNVDPSGAVCWSCVGIGLSWLALGGSLFTVEASCPAAETPVTAAACVGAILLAVSTFGALLLSLGRCISCLEEHPCRNRARIGAMKKKQRELDHEVASLKRRLRQVERTVHRLEGLVP